MALYIWRHQSGQSTHTHTHAHTPQGGGCFSNTQMSFWDNTAIYHENFHIIYNNVIIKSSPMFLLKHEGSPHRGYECVEALLSEY